MTNKLNHRVENGLMMETTACRAFESYRFEIQCVDVDNPDSSTPQPQYRVRFVDDGFPKDLSGCDGRVLDFGSWGRGQRLNRQNSSSLPDRRYLATHLAIARILHTSGIGEVIDQILREEEKVREEEIRQKEAEEYDPEAREEVY